MILIDDREDPCIVRYLSSHGVSAETTRLEFGDASWEGSGPGNRPVLVGLERKNIGDVVKSMTDRRLSGHQLRGMWSTFDYCYLVIEDVWRPSPEGHIEVFRGTGWRPLAINGKGITYRQLDSFLSSLEIRGNLIVARTGTAKETAALYASRYYWWNKPFDSHHAHDTIYSPGPETAKRRGKASPISRAPGLVEKLAAQLPGIDRLAWAVGRKFKTPEEMFLATKAEWMSIPGIGEGIARQAMESLHG